MHSRRSAGQRCRARSGSGRWAAFAWLSRLLGADGASAGAVDYDPTLGSLPSAQGWIHVVDDPLPDYGLTEANYTVAAGVLTQGDTGGPNVDDANRQWYHAPPVLFDFHTDLVVVDLRLKILSATLTPPGSALPRAGFGFFLIDVDGELVHLFVGSTGAFLLGQSSVASPLVAFDTTTGFHDYQVQVDATGATLLVDGVPETSLDRIDFNLVPTASSDFFFGDVTTLERGSSELESATVAVPEPGPGWWAVGLAALAGLQARRKRDAASARGAER